jgi:hypothetical protein
VGCGLANRLTIIVLLQLRQNSVFFIYCELISWERGEGGGVKDGEKKDIFPRKILTMITVRRPTFQPIKPSLNNPSPGVPCVQPVPAGPDGHVGGLISGPPDNADCFYCGQGPRQGAGIGYHQRQRLTELTEI